MKQEPFPKAIEIQTTAACNAACIICPHAEVSRKLPKGYMTEELFKKIIDDIGNKPIRIIPYLNSEPFLDPNFIYRLHEINKQCPNADIEISTNVSRLDTNVRTTLYGIRISELRLSVFGFTPETHKKMMPGLVWTQIKSNLDGIVEDTQLRARIKRIGLVMIDFPTITGQDIRLAKEYADKHGLEFNFWGFLDRARNTLNYSNNSYHERIKGCEQNRPLERMHITLDGLAILCCQDWTRQYSLGNVSRQTIETIWNSLEYDEIRRKIYQGLEAPEICKKCKLSIPQ